MGLSNWAIWKYSRTIVVAYVFFACVTLTVGALTSAVILSFPIGGYRLSRKNAERFPKIFFNALFALINYFLQDSHFIVYVDEVDLKRNQRNPEATISLIAKRFGLNGKIEELDAGESRNIIISNHQIYADWLYIIAFLGLLGRAGSVKIVCKRVLQFIPILGFVHILLFTLLCLCARNL